MKHFLAALFLGAFATTASAQYQVGDAKAPAFNNSGSLRDDDLAAFRATTTVFVVQPRDKPIIADFEKSLASVWTVTPFKVVSAEDMGQYRGPKYSLFTFGGYTVQVRSQNGMVTNNTHILYDLSLPDYNKRGDAKGRTLLARFVLSPDAQTVMTMSQQGNWLEGRNHREEREVNQSIQLNARAVYSNWGPGQIRGFVKSINDHLASGKTRGLFNEGTLQESLTSLRRDTLYLPDYVKERTRLVVAGFGFLSKNKGEDAGEEDFARSVPKAYPYPFRFVPADELDQMIVNATKPIYYLQYLRSSGNKHVCVVEGRSGQLVYSEFQNASFNFRAKDLKKLANAID